MNMKSIKDKIEKISFDDAKTLASKREYGLVYEISRVQFKRTVELDTINWSEVQEAYFFDEEGMVHIYQEDGVLLATSLKENAGDTSRVVDKPYKLANKFKKQSKEHLIVREYLNFDQDGQVFVEYVRPFSVE